MSNGLNVRGTGRGSGNQITDEERGLLSPGSTTSSKQASTKESAGRQPPSPGGRRSFNREETERMVRDEVARLRPTIPTRSRLYELILFDSIFFEDEEYDHASFDFRGTRMLGWELNYYFIGMALAHHVPAQRDVSQIVWLWNFIQEAFLTIPRLLLERRVPALGNQMNDRMWWAVQVGFSEEQARMHRIMPPVLPPWRNQRQASPPRRYLEHTGRR